MGLKERQRHALEALRHASAGEWTGADQVANVMKREGDRDASSQGIGRMLSQLADEGHCEKTTRSGYFGEYRIPLHAVVVYGDDGAEAGRLLLWQTKDGLELDLGQLEGFLDEHGHRLLLTGRDVRTVRAACDETLFRSVR